MTNYPASISREPSNQESEREREKEWYSRQELSGQLWLNLIKKKSANGSHSVHGQGRAVYRTCHAHAHAHAHIPTDCFVDPTAFRLGLGPHLSLQIFNGKSAFLPFSSSSQLIHNLYKNLSLLLRKAREGKASWKSGEQRRSVTASFFTNWAGVAGAACSLISCHVFWPFSVASCQFHFRFHFHYKNYHFYLCLCFLPLPLPPLLARDPEILSKFHVKQRFKTFNFLCKIFWHVTE